MTKLPMPMVRIGVRMRTWAKWVFEIREPRKKTHHQSNLHGFTTLHINSNKLQPLIKTVIIETHNDSKCKTQQLKPTQNATTNLISLSPPLSSIQTSSSHRNWFKNPPSIKRPTPIQQPTMPIQQNIWFIPPLKPSHWFNFNTGIETQLTPKRPPRHQTHGWSTMIQTHCWIFLYLTLLLLAYLYLIPFVDNVSGCFEMLVFL